MKTHTNQFIHAIVGLPVFASSLVVAQPPAKDYKNVTLKELGIKLAKPKMVDPKTGFAVAGKNSTSVIKKLTHINGVTIAKCEKRLRFLFDRYLRDDESLLAVMTADNRYVVDEMGLTHQALAKHLHVIGAIFRKRRNDEKFTYYGRRFKVSHVVTWTLPRGSPFMDGTEEYDTLLSVKNLNTGKKFEFYILMPHMIERYGFYAGKKNRNRVDPRRVVDVLSFLKDNAKKK